MAEIHAAEIKNVTMNQFLQNCLLQSGIVK